MKAITLRGLDEKTLKMIKKMSKKSHQSMNEFILNLIKSKVGTAKKEPNTDFDFLMGAWNKKDEESFTKATQLFETIDQELWK